MRAVIIHSYWSITNRIAVYLPHLIYPFMLISQLCIGGKYPLIAGWHTSTRVCAVCACLVPSDMNRWLIKSGVLTLGRHVIPTVSSFPPCGPFITSAVFFSLGNDTFQFRIFSK